MILRFLLIGILLSYGLTQAQTTMQLSPDPGPRPVRLYISRDGELTSPERSVVRRETNIDFQTLIISGVYKDYTRDGHLVADGIFNEGVMHGLNTQYFENGRVKSTIEYEDDGFIVWEFFNDKGESQLTHGTGKFSLGYNDVGSVDQGGGARNKTVIGEFVKGRRSGTWTYLDSHGQKTDEEFYEEGKLISRMKFDESGATLLGTNSKKTISISRNEMETLSFDKGAYQRIAEYFENNVPEYPGVSQRRISYPGGLRKMLLFISQNVAIPQSDDLYPVRLRVTEHGEVHFRFQPFLNADLEAKFTRVLKVCEPMILPEVHNGKTISSSLRIPISNAAWWIDFLKTAPEDEIYNYVRGIWFNR